MSTRIARKLTTIMAADAERFSAAMEADEVGTYSQLRAARDVFTRLIEHHGGRIANTAGDGLIADFPSVVEAAQCAIEVQQELLDKDNGLLFRIGIHLGDVICDGEDLIGEGVNLAARLQTMAEPGGILISRQVYDHVRNKLSIGFEYLGEKRPKNLPEDISVYRISIGAAFADKAERAAQATRPRVSATQRRESQIAKVWSDPDLEGEGVTRDFSAEPDAEESTTESRGFLARMDRPKRLKIIGFGLGAVVGLNVLSGGAFWIAWPLLVFALIYGLLHGEALLERKTIKSLPVKLWVLGAFLVCVNLMSWSGTPWVIWPLGAMALIGWLTHGRRAKKTAQD